MLSMFSQFSWNKTLSIKTNLYNLIQEYIPYSLNFLTKKNHILQAKELLSDLESTANSSDIDLYFGVQAIRQDLKGEGGEFIKRLNFAVEQMESQYPFFKTLDTAGQSFIN